MRTDGRPDRPKTDGRTGGWAGGPTDRRRYDPRAPEKARPAVEMSKSRTLLNVCGCGVLPADHDHNYDNIIIIIAL